MDSKSNTPPYPGSDLSVSQLLAALDQKIPAEIAWVESNARSKGILTHFRKPETNTLKSHALQFLTAVDHLANSLQPMSLLPPEMVSRIATYLIDEVEYYRPLLVATHVSRYWRETLLGCSSLWSSIDSCHPRLAVICMERSKTARLAVKLRPNITLDFVSNLQLHTRRIKALDIKMSVSDFQNLLLQLDPPSIRLESMTLNLNSVHPLSCTSFPLLLSLDVSRLKVLDVQNVLLTSPFFRPTNLSKLSIVSSDGRLSILLDLIAANPNLEEIIIVSRVSNLNYPPGDGVISLPHLRVLNATLPLYAIKTLLRLVSLPPSTNLIVTTAMQEHDQKEFLPTLLPQTLDPLRNLLRIETLTYHYSKIANYQTLCGSSPNTSQTHPHPPLQGGSFTFRWTAFTRFDLVFSPLSLSHVRHLQFNLDCVYSFRGMQAGRVDSAAYQYASAEGRDWYSEWRGAFRSLNRLERLTVIRLKDLVELVELLTDHMEPPDPTPRLEICHALGRDPECRNNNVSNIRSTLPLSHRKGCHTDPLCPFLHTLEFIECHWLCNKFPILLNFVKRRSPPTSPRDSPVPSSAPYPTSTLHPPTYVSPIRHIRVQSNRPSLLPRSQDIEELRELVDTVIMEVGPQKCSSSRGVESPYRSGAGVHGNRPPLCAVCGTDLGLS